MRLLDTPSRRRIPRGKVDVGGRRGGVALPLWLRRRCLGIVACRGFMCGCCKAGVMIQLWTGGVSRNGRRSLPRGLDSAEKHDPETMHGYTSIVFTGSCVSNDQIKTMPSTHIKRLLHQPTAQARVQDPSKTLSL